jgi:hypothetical protein
MVHDIRVYRPTHSRRRSNLTSKRKQPAAKATFIESMECLPVAKLPEGPEWSYEIKLYRLATGGMDMEFCREALLEG